MRTTEFKDTELGPIPKDWEVKRVGEIGEIVTGATPPRFDGSNWNGDFAWISARDFTEKYIENTVENVTEKGKRYCRCLPADSVLITCIASIGLNAICKVPCATNQQINAVVCHGDDPEYFYYAMAHSKGRFASLAGQTAVPIINKQQFSDFALAFPPLPEQRRIAAALGDVDKLIENLKKRVEKKKNLKRGAMQELLTGKRRLRGLCDLGVRKEGLGVSRGERRERGELFATTTEFKDTELGPIPKDWEVKRLGMESLISRGGSPRPIQAWLTDSVDGVNWVKIGDVSVGAKYITNTKERIVPAGARFSREVKPGDFILSNSMSFGRPYILKIGGCIHDGWLAIQEYSAAFDTEYLYYILSSDNVFRQYVAMAAGSSVKNLNKEKVSDVKIPLPPLPEQRAIAAVLSDMDAEIANLEHKLKKMTLLKQGMMQDLLTGKVRLV